ncbi:hypothetical protein Tco_1123331 [Tanacetum coccineum]|uniref:Uncharacterized protein n=1 Tax=Tanacetum coccineum TaxID=301880 RepID=A0ABQ5J3K6_9ASTR
MGVLHDDYLYCADHTAKLGQEKWVNIVNHDGKWIEEEEEEDFDNALTVSFYHKADPWVSLVQVVLKKGGMTVVNNEKEELIPQRTVTDWRVCIDYLLALFYFFHNIPEKEFSLIYLGRRKQEGEFHVGWKNLLLALDKKKLDAQCRQYLVTLLGNSTCKGYTMMEKEENLLFINIKNWESKKKSDGILLSILPVNPMTVKDLVKISLSTLLKLNQKVTNEKDVSAPKSQEVEPSPSTKEQWYIEMPDENQILLKVPRHHNMYSFDMKTPSPAKGTILPKSLENQANPHAVLRSNKQSRTTSTTQREEDTLTEPQKEKKDSEMKDSSTNPKIQAFRRELEEIALKHLGNVPENNTTSTHSINTGSHTVNTGRLDHDDSLMPELEIFHKPETGIFDEASYDEEGVITDFNSLPTEIEVSPTPTLRIHSIHPKSQILGDPKSAVQTRSKVQNKSGAHALLCHTQKQQRNNHKDQQHCLFACFLSQEEPNGSTEIKEMKEVWL